MEQGANPMLSPFSTCLYGQAWHKWWAGWHPKTQLPRYPGTWLRRFPKFWCLNLHSDSLNSFLYISLRQPYFVQNFRWTKTKNQGVELSVRNERKIALNGRNAVRMLQQKVRQRPGLQAVSHTVNFVVCPGQNGEKGCVCPNQSNCMCDDCKRNLDVGISWFLRTLELKDGVFSASKNFPTTKWTTRRGVPDCISDFLSFAQSWSALSTYSVFCKPWLGEQLSAPGLCLVRA